MLRFELKRGFRSIGFRIAMIIMIAVAIAQAYTEALPIARNPLERYDGSKNMPGPPHVLNTWIGMYSRYERPLLIVLLILVTMAYGLSYAMDLNSGYVKNILICKSRKDYLNAKFVSVFLTAGVVGVTPYIANFLIVSCMNPLHKPYLGMATESYYGKAFSWLYFHHPALYVMMYMLITFLYSGAFATIALAFTHIVRNAFLLGLTPFLMGYFVLKYASYLVGTSLAPNILMRMGTTADRVNVWVFAFEWLVVTILSYLIYFNRGKSMDVL